MLLDTSKNTINIISSFSQLLNPYEYIIDGLKISCQHKEG